MKASVGKGFRGPFRRAGSMAVAVIVAAGLLTVGVATSPVVAKDIVKGKPGKVTKKKTVRASHWDPCAPGGINIGKDPIFGGNQNGCWQPWLAGNAFTVKKSNARKYKKKAQRVTVQRQRAVSWSGKSGTWNYYADRAVTRTISKKKKSTKFPRWSKIYSSGFGYYMAFYKITWRTSKGKFIGSRVTPVNSFKCATNFRCSSGRTWAWLDTPWR